MEILEQFLPPLKFSGENPGARMNKISNHLTCSNVAVCLSVCVTSRQIAMAYIGATSGAVIVSVGMNMMVKVMYHKLVKHVCGISLTINMSDVGMYLMYVITIFSVAFSPNFPAMGSLCCHGSS